MEEKYRKLAVSLGIKEKNNNNLDETMTTPCEEVKNANDYYEYENAKLKLKIKLLTDVIAEQREYTNILEETKNDLERKVIDLRINLAKRDEEIETLKKIIDKCNTTYYSNSKVQTVYDGTVKAVEECVKQRSKKDGNN